MPENRWLMCWIWSIADRSLSAERRRAIRVDILERI